MRLTFSDAQRNVAEIANRESYNKDVIFELLAAYGRSASAITKLRSGSLNLADDKENEVLQRGVVYFKHVTTGSLRSVIDSLDQDSLVVRYNPRYLIATDYNQLVAKDTKKDTTLDIKLRDIDRNVDFFYGWTGDEVTSEKTEAVVDRRAADKMKDLYAEIELVNREKLADSKSTFRHDLNVFFSRLLFCFFAEDTRIFSKEEKTIFTSSIKDYTQTDGSDLDVFLNTLFDALDTANKVNFTSPYSKFPYVNGTIFDTKKHNIAIPKFNAQARKLMLDCGNLDWSAINPDIFGSMFQSIVDEDHRASNGMHYTSVPNIMKTIEPLFLDQLREEFDANYDNPKKLEKLWDRISKIKVFDPACGSGNFLIIAYKEIRKIEHGIIDRLFSDDYKRAMLSGKLESKIKLDNFYGIEIDDFAHEIAILSLYLAKHQMNIEFEEHFGKEIILIPLKDNAKIVHGNAARLDWEEVCPNVQHVTEKQKPNQQLLIEVEQENEQGTLISDDDLKQKTWDEVYLIGNPPYLGGKSIKEQSQKEDVKLAHKGRAYSKNIDYISIWFIKASEYIKGTSAQYAFVSTNSIVQGEQVEMLWPFIFDNGLEISFAYTSFKWVNNATANAGVTCIVVGVANKGVTKNKRLYTNDLVQNVENINAYLAGTTNNTIVSKKQESISGLPRLVLGSMPKDGGFLILDPEQREELLQESPWASRFIKRFIGSADLIRGIERYCLWIGDSDVDQALSSKIIKSRIEHVANFRLESDAESTRRLANISHRFIQRSYQPKSALLIPLVSSERREYIPMAYVDDQTVVSSLSFALYDAELWLFGILNSKICMSWVKAVGGKMKTDYRFSAVIVYNTLPIPVLTSVMKEEVTSKARDVLFARENHSEKTLAEMYNPDKMPEDLKQAHYELDLVVDRLYRAKPYASDEERLADLFALYEQMTATEKEKIA